MNYSITKISDCDIPQIAEIEKQCFSDPWTERQIKEFSDSEGSFGWVCREENTENVLGYITTSIILDEMYIANIAVHENYRRCGVGSSIMNALIAEAKSKDISFITLEVRQSNISAIEFYTKNGFQKCGTRKNYYSNPTEDANLMTLYFKKQEI